MGSATDLSWITYWYDHHEKIQKVRYWFDPDVKDYQEKCRYHEENVSEMADAIMGERLYAE